MSEMRLIDANALKEHLGIDGDRKYINRIAHETSDYIDEMPTIDAVPVVHARWVDNHCTACGMMPMGDEMWEHLDETPPRMEFFMSYCPCCGAKMDAKDESPIGGNSDDLVHGNHG